jgi:hypothetical protein
MKNALLELKYIENQFFAVMPFPPNSANQGQIRIKLQSAHGATNWLNIEPRDFLAIERILTDSYAKREAAE